MKKLANVIRMSDIQFKEKGGAVSLTLLPNGSKLNWGIAERMEMKSCGHFCFTDLSDSLCCRCHPIQTSYCQVCKQ